MVYFHDTYAIIKLIGGAESYGSFKHFKIITSVLNIGEVYAILLRNFGKNRADEWFKGRNFEIVEITPETITEATYFRYMNRKEDLSITDCVGYILSLKTNLKFLTGGKEFQNMENVEFVK